VKSNRDENEKQKVLKIPKERLQHEQKGRALKMGTTRRSSQKCYSADSSIGPSGSQAVERGFLKNGVAECWKGHWYCHEVEDGPR
jgi:hypothetical protein